MFGRGGRTNSIPDAGFIDGSTDRTSSAFSPLVTNGMNELRPVRVYATQPDGFRVQSSATTGAWNNSFDGVAKYVDQTAGGQSGNANTLGWSTGLRPRKESRTPLTGRTLVVPNMGVHPVVGSVGRDNRANRLLLGVQSQTTDYTPLSAAELAQTFVGSKGFDLGGE